MSTYSVRCRVNACRHRRVTKQHPDTYTRPPACPSCGSRKGWRIEGRQFRRHQKRCRCSGPEVAFGRFFPHQPDHPLCDHHPHGFYNQARARGVAHDDIPKEHWPMDDTLKPDNAMTRWDNFAAAALAGITGHPESGCNSPRDLAHHAAQCADMLMAERARRMAEAGQ